MVTIIQSYIVSISNSLESSNFNNLHTNSEMDGARANKSTRTPVLMTLIGYNKRIVKKALFVDLLPKNTI